MSADESVILLPLSRHPACLYKNFSLAFTFWIIDETILSPFKRLSILSPKYLTLSVAFITWPLHTTWKLVIFLSFLRGPNNMHSVLPRWRESLLSTSQDEHDSNTFPSLFDITSGFYEGTGWHCHQHTRWVCSHCQYSSTCHWHKLKIKGDQGYYLEGRRTKHVRILTKLHLYRQTVFCQINMIWTSWQTLLPWPSTYHIKYHGQQCRTPFVGLTLSSR